MDKPLPAVPKAPKLSGINFVGAGIYPLSSPRGNDRAQETGSGENRPAPLRLMCPGQSQRRPSPARPGPTSTPLKDEAAPAPGSPRVPPAPDRITCSGLGQSRAVAPPQRGRGLGCHSAPDPGKARQPTAPLAALAGSSPQGSPFKGAGRGPRGWGVDYSFPGHQLGLFSGSSPACEVRKPGCLERTYERNAGGWASTWATRLWVILEAGIFSVPAAVSNGF